MPGTCDMEVFLCSFSICALKHLSGLQTTKKTAGLLKEDVLCLTDVENFDGVGLLLEAKCAKLQSRLLKKRIMTLRQLSQKTHKIRSVWSRYGKTVPS